ncbi:MAG: hypothetical protein H6907_18900 [Hyphomicrobiales bacterium]|nr:hypothetical protein [Hyphomicrobiales bacterium]
MSAEEVIQRNELSTLLLRLGYNVYLPVYDHGIDLIAHREADGDTKVIQQKSRWTIARKYLGRNIWIAFRSRGVWYLAPHDEMVAFAEAAGYTASRSWVETGLYHRAAMSKAMEEAYGPYRLVAGDTAQG